MRSPSATLPCPSKLTTRLQRVRPASSPGLFFEVPSTQRFTPNCYTNIEKVLYRKLACLEAHRSQVAKTNIEDLTILELAVSCANFRGIQARVKYAEAFQSVRLLLDI